MPDHDRVAIPGSERRVNPDHVRLADVDPAAELDVTVYLAHHDAPEWVDAEAQRPPADRRVLTREQWTAAHGARPQDIDAVTAFAAAHGLTVTATDPAQRSVSLRGTADAVSAAFGVDFAGVYASQNGAPGYRARTGSLTVPAALEGIVTGVFGIDDRPVASPHLRFAATAAAAAVSYTPVQVAQAYAFPTGVDGTGETVAIIELGGGFSTEDLTTYFTGLKLATPSVTAVAVGAGSNDPGADPNADGEVMLDIEVVGAVAPGAKIVVYFAPNTDQGFIDAVSQAVHDTTHAPSVVSISWGDPEDAWTAQARAQMEQTLTDAAALGVTVTAAAGDNGSTDGVTDGRQHVDFPASAPHALACGGTHLIANGPGITSETVWGGTAHGATGGGVSRQFALPSYQSAAKVPDNVDGHTPGRGVPDVAGDADPATGYAIRVDGNDETIGGTSAVAPLWAGLIALINQAQKAPVGFAQPRLYALLGSTAFHDVTSGSNGAYAAGPGWDACTGLGSPDGSVIAARIGGAES